MKILFFVKAYNDVDHFSPIIHRLLSTSIPVHIIVFSDLSLNGDYRIDELKKSAGLTIEYIEEKYRIARSKKKISRLQFYLNKFKSHNSLYGLLKRKYFLDCRREVEFLKNNDIHALVIEWSTPASNGLAVEKYFRAAKSIGCTTYSLPHGCNIYKNPDVNNGYVNSSYKGRMLDDAEERNKFDYYIFQGKTRRDQCVKLGYAPNSTQNWGSVRFYPEWQKLNLQICPSFDFKLKEEGVFKIVFMDHQHDYNVYPGKIEDTLRVLSNLKGVFVLLKASTREGKSAHIESYERLIQSSSNIQFAPDNAHSPSLIKWADCVINYGSSIGLEALIQNKPLVTPTYLDSNVSLFDFYNAGYIVNDDEDMVGVINELISDPCKQYKDSQIECINNLMNEIVYGGNGEHDVVQSYVDNIISHQLNY